MEDAHACVLDLKPHDKEKDTEVTDSSTRISFFGVYDGHGGEKVALYAGENLHKIVAKQDAFMHNNFEQALKDGFLATDKAILDGSLPSPPHTIARSRLSESCRPEIRRGSLWLHSICWYHHSRQDICRMFWRFPLCASMAEPDRETLATRALCSA